MCKEQLSSFSSTEQSVVMYFIKLKLDYNLATFSLGQKQLAKILYRHENSITNALSSLEKKGWIAREKAGKKMIITFTPPAKELPRLLCFFSDDVSYSLANLNRIEELQKIISKLLLERDRLQKELDNRLKIDSKVNEFISQITDEQIYEFIDILSEKIGNVFDNSSLDEKIFIAIRLFQERVGLVVPAITQEKIVQQNDPYKRFGDWKPSAVKKGADLVKPFFDDD